MHVTLARALYQAALSLVGLHLARRNAQHANQGLSPAHPRYNDAAALLGGGLAHAAKSRTVSRRWREYIVDERCGDAFGALRKRWHYGRELARLGRRDPTYALEVLGGGGSKGAAGAARGGRAHSGAPLRAADGNTGGAGGHGGASAWDGIELGDMGTGSNPAYGAETPAPHSAAADGAYPGSR